MQCVVDLGGIIKSNISRKTDFVVLGKQDKTLVGKDGMSTKERKARELVDEGHNIRMINEGEFLEFVAMGERV